MTYGGAVRAQVLEVIVRQAIAGAPWREICAGPMLVNKITPEEVEAEVYRRMYKGRDKLSAEENQALTAYVEGWQAVLGERKLQPIAEIEEAVTSVYARRNLEKPSIVVCKSPAVMYLHLMLLTAREDFASQNFDCDSNVRAVSMLSQGQSDTFKSHLFESIKELLSTVKKKPGPAVRLSWKDDHSKLRESLNADMNRHLDSDLSNYFTWGFRASTENFLRRVGVVYDASLGIAKSIAGVYHSDLPSAPDEEILTARIRQQFMALNPDNPEPEPQLQLLTRLPRPGGVLRASSIGVWEMPEILSNGFVLENLKKGEAYSAFVREQLRDWLALFRAAPMYAFFENLCLVADYPHTVILDDLLRPSNNAGPAIVFPDHYQVFAIDGIVVPRKLVENPQDLTLDEIEDEENAASRRLMIDMFGTSRYLMDSGAALIHEDEFGQLYRKEIPGDEPIVMLCVINSTMEPDGTYNKYFLRVPPRTATAREGVAWTFGLMPVEYRPTEQS